MLEQATPAAQVPGLDGTVILQVLPRLEVGGVERGTIEMVAAIAGAGGVPIVASAGGRMEGLVARAGGRHVTLKLASKHPLRILANAARLARLIRREGVDIVHARSRAPAWSAWMASRRTGAHFVTTYHGLYGERPRWKRRYNAVMARGERVIAISDFVAWHVADTYGLDHTRVRVIPRGVDPGVFSPERVTGPRIARLAEAWRLPHEARVVMLPGRLTRWKGGEVLLDAIAAMRHADVVAVLVGGEGDRPGYGASLVRRAERLGIAERVRFAGHCDDMPAALSLADVVVAPSTRPEAFGRSVIEAQAMGKPVIAADHGGAAETIEPGATGWHVPPGDPAALAEMVDFVLDLTPDELATLGWHARCAVHQRFSTAAMQSATLAVYRELEKGGTAYDRG